MFNLFGQQEKKLDIDHIKTQMAEISEDFSKLFLENYPDNSNDDYTEQITKHQLLTSLLVKTIKLSSESLRIIVPQQSLAAEYIWAIREMHIFYTYEFHSFLYNELGGAENSPKWTYGNRVLFDLFFSKTPYIDLSRHWDIEKEKGRRKNDPDQGVFFIEGDYPYRTFYDWEHTFRKVTRQEFIKISESETGSDDKTSLIDFIDFSFEDVRYDAYRDRVDPIKYGEYFAEGARFMIDEKMVGKFFATMRKRERRENLTK